MIFDKMMRPAEEKQPFVGSPSHGSGARAQVFEVIVRQAIAGAPWREICAGPMNVNQITPDQVEVEVRRRRGGDNQPPLAPVPKNLLPPEGSGSIALTLPLPSQQLTTFRTMIVNLAQSSECDTATMRTQLGKVISELDSLLSTVRRLEQSTNRTESEAQLQQDLDREMHRTRQEFKPGEETGPHHVTWKP